MPLEERRKKRQIKASRFNRSLMMVGAIVATSYATQLFHNTFFPDEHNNNNSNTGEVNAANSVKLPFVEIIPNQDLPLEAVEILPELENNEWHEFHNGFIANGYPEDEISNSATNFGNFLEEYFTKFTPEFLDLVESLNIHIKLVHQGMEFDQDSGIWIPIGGFVDTIDNHLTIVLVSGAEKSSMDHELTHLIADHVSIPWEAPVPHIYQSFYAIQKKYNLDYLPRDTSYGKVNECDRSIVIPGYDYCYGQWNVKEDVATIAESLLAGESKNYERAESDPALREKIDAIIAYFEYLSKGTMNREYFEKLVAMHNNPEQNP